MKPSKRFRFLHEFLVRLQNFPSHEIGHVQLFCFWYDCVIPLIDMLVQGSANVSEKCVWTLDPQIMPPKDQTFHHFFISKRIGLQPRKNATEKPGFHIFQPLRLTTTFHLSLRGARSLGSSWQ